MNKTTKRIVGILIIAGIVAALPLLVGFEADAVRHVFHCSKDAAWAASCISMCTAMIAGVLLARR